MCGGGPLAQITCLHVRVSPQVPSFFGPLILFFGAISSLTQIGVVSARSPGRAGSGGVGRAAHFNILYSIVYSTIYYTL